MEFAPTVRITLPPGTVNKSDFIARRVRQVVERGNIQSLTAMSSNRWWFKGRSLALFRLWAGYVGAAMMFVIVLGDPQQ